MSSKGAGRARGTMHTGAWGHCAAFDIDNCVGWVHVQSLKYARRRALFRLKTEHSAALCRVWNYCGGVSWHTRLLPRVPGSAPLCPCRHLVPPSPTRLSACSRLLA